MRNVLIASAVLLSVFTVQTQAQTAVPTTFVGYLCTFECARNGHDPAGHDLTIHPEQHTVSCMMGCAFTGLGIYVRAAGSEKYVYHGFDKAGSDTAYKDILLKTVKKDGVRIQVEGVIADDGSIAVASIREIEDVDE